MVCSHSEIWRYWSISSETAENGLIAQGDQLVATEVVGAALHVADAQVSDEGFEEGNVAEVELILEGLGSGGDDDAQAGAQGGEQVSEGFAGACAGLDDEMAALFEGALDGFGHLQLAGAVLERAETSARGCRRERRTRGAWAGRGLGCRWLASGTGALLIIVMRDG